VLARVDKVLAPLTWIAAVFAVIVLLVGPEVIGAEKDTTAAGAQEPAAISGEALFAENGCGSCHTFSKAGSTGDIGPNLDDAAPDAARVTAIVTSGSGAMPSFADRLSEAEIQALAEYVSG
jgi:cytochrome c6